MDEFDEHLARVRELVDEMHEKRNLTCDLVNSIFEGITPDEYILRVYDWYTDDNFRVCVEGHFKTDDKPSDDPETDENYVTLTISGTKELYLEDEKKYLEIVFDLDDASIEFTLDNKNEALRIAGSLYDYEPYDDDTIYFTESATLETKRISRAISDVLCKLMTTRDNTEAQHTLMQKLKELCMFEILPNFDTECETYELLELQNSKKTQTVKLSRGVRTIRDQHVSVVGVEWCEEGTNNSVDLEIKDDGSGHIRSTTEILPRYVDLEVIDDPLAKTEIEDAILAFDWLHGMLSKIS